MGTIQEKKEELETLLSLEPCPSDKGITLIVCVGGGIQWRQNGVLNIPKFSPKKTKTTNELNQYELNNSNSFFFRGGGKGEELQELWSDKLCCPSCS